MFNKYLEKIADFDFDAHHSLVNSVQNTKTIPGGWQGNLDQFNSVSKRRASGKLPVSSAKPVRGILSKILGKIK